MEAIRVTTVKTRESALLGVPTHRTNSFALSTPGHSFSGLRVLLIVVASSVFVLGRPFTVVYLDNCDQPVRMWR
ncbi:hypothetical protein JAAARDRAFT_604621 [Jaapia argillacea MUCL 33604]|uniref:Uncharacterized protein n=1 Tax=Jaapia argillacea MUCL 33604 TaxID=933084 RepID=A0A067QCS4_9AGAM|nr:hypothetical protein JAAARDRAFT_604621 [Jaapia argillacea MUCL 33604]